ncbi:hypothetical protein [Brachyspira hampsonii]|uniref:Uncharacterized protein n=1 Tax=Brachyspira hampsonii 30446 TaxID=1289135 RepID=A0A2U4F599_9SPIR|nr:hypothetical protein [Brachyspira hampsonii]EKV56140.1 hypothetical protein A966_12306 [Brachyspira hampsonii 30446]MBW5388917.1 hypothetical protein [Brachyspira hampsonii]MBW5394841.1 hypothetical protein [Brachyspira hampsonii]OEJ18020.1 hypothetical protein A9495_06325 [Brachyspira hampsonii]
MIENSTITLEKKLGVVEDENHYTWIINSTGSNTYGTTFSPDLEKYLSGLGFVKIFAGSPIYGTSRGYNEDEIRDICSTIMNARVKYGQNVEQVRCIYFPGSYLKCLMFDTDKK